MCVCVCVRVGMCVCVASHPHVLSLESAFTFCARTVDWPWPEMKVQREFEQKQKNSHMRASLFLFDVSIIRWVRHFRRTCFALICPLNQKNATYTTDFWMNWLRVIIIRGSIIRGAIIRGSYYKGSTVLCSNRTRVVLIFGTLTTKWYCVFENFNL